MSKITIALEAAVAAVSAATPVADTRPTARQRADADRAFGQILKLIAPRIRHFIRQYGLVAHWEDAEQACAIGVHRRTMTVEQAAQRFTDDAGLQGPAALSEARRATWDPTYGRYTWGKLEIQRLRDRARARPGFALAGFHRDLLALGCPPLGLLDAALA